MPAIGFERLKEYNSQSDLKMIDFCTQNAESEIALVETPILPPLAGDHPGRTPGAGLSATGQLHIGEFSGCLFEQRAMTGRAYRRHVSSVPSRFWREEEPASKTSVD
jgi:hypothetical protein